MSPLVSEMFTKALLPYLKIFSTSPWHDHHRALVKPLFLVMLD
jgi:hypothetical protein